MSKKEKNLGFEKQINISKRGYQIIFIEKAKVYVSGKTITYSKKDDIYEKTFNIPYLNTSILMLGVGTSISNEAVRLAADNNLIIMFVNSSLSSSSSTDPSFNVLSPNSEYRPTQYLQRMTQIFFNEDEKITVAKKILSLRTEVTIFLYNKLKKENFVSDIIIDNYIKEKENFLNNIQSKQTINHLLLEEAAYTKKVYKIFAKESNIDFNRNHEFNKKPINEIDFINNNLTHLNYLCYGLSASMLNTLGVSYGLPILHGKTRRGALVFDVADIIKDGFSIPLSFHSKNNLSESELRKLAISIIEDYKIFDLLFEKFIEVLS